MRKSFTYKARINSMTRDKAELWLDLCCRLYNAALEQRIIVYRQDRIFVHKFAQMKELPNLKKEFPEFGEVGSQVLQQVIDRLDGAYKNFFRRCKQWKLGKDKPGFPRFKSRDRYDSFTLKQTGWSLDGRDFRVANMGRFRLHLSQPIQGRIKTVTVRRTSTGKWFVTFSCEDVPARVYPEVTMETGIDLGIHAFCVDADGRRIENPKFLTHSECLLRRRQRALDRKVKGSGRRKQNKQLVARTYERIANQRRDFQFKTANYYIQNYGSIYVENLQIKNMVQNRHLAKSIGDCAWGTFVSILACGAAEANREFGKINPYGTSQRCSRCGEWVAKTLKERVHRCPYCGLVLDRDHNAAINILRAGQALRARNIQPGVSPRIS